MSKDKLTVSVLLASASARLKAAGVDDARTDARRLLQVAAGWTAVDLIFFENDIIATDIAAKMDALVDRRASGEPVSRIKGMKEFWGRDFIVTPHVLDPRPDTEVLVEQALALWDETPGEVLDLGTGSGAILLTLLAERKSMRGIGVDVSRQALDVARQNAEQIGVVGRVSWIEGSWFDAVPSGSRFSLIVSNPPYIPGCDLPGLDREVRDHDPALALDGGPDGLAPYREIVVNARDRLVDNGALAVEVGIGQAEDVAEMMKDAGFAGVGVCKDLSGIMRSVYGHKRLPAAHYGK